MNPSIGVASGFVVSDEPSAKPGFWGNPSEVRVMVVAIGLDKSTLGELLTYLKLMEEFAIAVRFILLVDSDDLRMASGLRRCHVERIVTQEDFKNLRLGKDWMDYVREVIEARSRLLGVRAIWSVPSLGVERSVHYRLCSIAGVSVRWVTVAPLGA